MSRPMRRAREDLEAPAFRVMNAGRTDVGLVRGSNEDAFLCRAEARLWAVADGMGGHDEGEWASAAIAGSLANAQIAGDFEADCVRVAQAIHAANGAIHRRADARRVRMGSTVVALLLAPDRFAAFWVGDSRVYRLRAGSLVQITTDHTQVQSKVARGLMTVEEARSHPMAHVLTRAVGVEAAVDLAGLRGDVEPGDTFLLCSDGLHGIVTDAEIAGALVEHAPAAACDRLLALCHARGAPDNVTLVAIAVAPR